MRCYIVDDRANYLKLLVSILRSVEFLISRYDIQIDVRLEEVCDHVTIQSTIPIGESTVRVLWHMVGARVSFRNWVVLEAVSTGFLTYIFLHP